MNKEKPALVVLSGGQDSVTCLGVAMRNHPEVHAIGFQYGQRHSIEQLCAQNICDILGVEFKIVELGFLANLVTSALTGTGSVSEAHSRRKDLPASFVPNRNAIFLTLAHAYAQEIGAETIYAGVCQTDYSGYPDCRQVFIQEIQLALNIGYETNIDIETPLMNLTKADTFHLAQSYGFLEMVLEHSHTCYEGERLVHRSWGYGCGECPACILRKRGWEEFLTEGQ